MDKHNFLEKANHIIIFPYIVYAHFRCKKKLISGGKIMLLTSIVQDLDFQIIQGNLNKDIHSIAFDSRDIEPGSLFIAISGFTVDGHNFINQAIENGATTIIVEDNIQINKDITVLKVVNSRDALARISTNFYKHPSNKINLIGITGTNGKTSTTYFIKSIFEKARESIAIIGTIGTVINDKTYENKNTTPESLHLQQFFSKINESNTKNCMMEVSSHALNLDRVAYTEFDTGIFTNLSPDHLELHKNMDEYFYAKAKLFKQTKKYNIINIDDIYGKKLVDLAASFPAQILTYGIYDNADIYPTDIFYAFDHTTYTVNTPTGQARITVNLPGEIYLYNSLAAIACAYCNGVPMKIIQKGIKSLTSIKGRFEVVYEKENFKIIIDFAHTEDALKKTLNIIKPFVKGRLILVFGVYADTSKNGTDKRIGMGKVAAKNANFSIITLDNPKHHDQNLIIKEISEAMEQEQANFKTILDREEAIRYAIKISNEDDVIIIAGKGHETSQVIGDVEIPFNEKEIVLDALTVKI